MSTDWLWDWSNRDQISKYVMRIVLLLYNVKFTFQRMEQFTIISKDTIKFSSMGDSSRHFVQRSPIVAFSNQRSLFNSRSWNRIYNHFTQSFIVWSTFGGNSFCEPSLVSLPIKSI